MMATSACSNCFFALQEQLRTGCGDRTKSLHNKRDQENYQLTYIQLLLETIESQQNLDMNLVDGQVNDWPYLATETGISKWFQSEEDSEPKKFSYIWAKYSLEDQQNPEKNGFKENYRSILPRRTAERLQLWYWDETGFSLRVIRRELGNKGQPEDYRAARAWTSQCDGGIREQDRKRSAFHREEMQIPFVSRFSSYMNLSRMNGLLRKFSWTVPTNRTEDCACFVPAITSS